MGIIKLKRNGNWTSSRKNKEINGMVVIYSDGIEADFLSFNSGVIARIEVAEKEGWLFNYLNKLVIYLKPTEKIRGLLYDVDP